MFIAVIMGFHSVSSIGASFFTSNIYLRSITYDFKKPLNPSKDKLQPLNLEIQIYLLKIKGI